MIKQSLANMWDDAMSLNKVNILSYVDRDSNARLLDLGCDDGSWTLSLAGKIGTSKLYGIEIIEKAIAQSNKKGIECIKSDLNQRFPFDSNFFDVVHANQVIEHIANIDHFMSEIYRVVKPGGYVVISTENGSSWCNIGAAIMGWQIFSLTNVSSQKYGIGNPFSLHRGEKSHASTWTHKTIFNYLGLKEFFIVYGFEQCSLKGAGYFPFPSFLGRIDGRHAHFLTIKGYKSVRV